MSGTLLFHAFRSAIRRDHSAQTRAVDNQLQGPIRTARPFLARSLLELAPRAWNDRELQALSQQMNDRTEQPFSLAPR